MTDPLDRAEQELEQELARMRPARLPADLRTRIAAGIAADGPADIGAAGPVRPPIRFALWTALAAGLAVALGLAWWPAGSGDNGRREPRIVKDGQPKNGAEERPVRPAPAPETSSEPPTTVWAYNRAAAAGPEELDRLLDRHAERVLAARGPTLTAGPFGPIR